MDWQARCPRTPSFHPSPSSSQGQDQYEKALPLLLKHKVLSAERDLLVLQFGLHHWKDYQQRLGDFAKFYRQRGGELPRLLWQQTAQQHFTTPAGSGEFGGGKPPFNCSPIANFTVEVRAGVSACRARASLRRAGLWAGRRGFQVVGNAGGRLGVPIPRWRCMHCILAALPSQFLCPLADSLPVACAPYHPQPPALLAQGEGTVLLQEGKSDPHSILAGNWRNAAADPVIRELGIPILPSHNESLWMWQFHRDNGHGWECTHFCTPSAPQVGRGLGWAGLLPPAARRCSKAAAGLARAAGLLAASGDWRCLVGSGAPPPRSKEKRCMVLRAIS